MTSTTASLALAALLSAAHAGTGSSGAGGGTAGTGASAGTARVEQLVRDLEELAGWCQDERLHAERDEVLEALLRFAPDHAGARRRLKYRRGSDGWYRSDTYRAPRSRGDDAAREELAARRARLAAAWRAAVAEGGGPRISDESGAGPAEGRNPEREKLFADLLAIDPDCAAARAARGEVRDGGAWVLAETAAARTRRPALAAEARRLLAGEVAVTALETTAAELDLGCAGAAFETTHARAAGGVAPRELEQLALHAEASVRLLLSAAEIHHFRPRPFRLLVARDAAQRRAFERAHPDLIDRAAGLARYTSFWVPGTRDLVVAESTPAERLRQVRRHAVALVLADRYGVTRGHAATFEALAGYVTALLGEEDVGSLPGSLARLRERDEPPSMARLSTHTATAGLGPADRDACRALGAFLLEGDPRRARAVLGWLGKLHSLRDAVEHATHRDLEHLESRLWRWIHEA